MVSDTDQRIDIHEGVVQNALIMLREQGFERQTTVETMYQRLLGEVRRQYPTARQFTDQQGPLWVIDVSRTFNNMMLYAVARDVGGKLEVVHLADEAELDPFFAERRLPRETPGPQPSVPEDPSEPLPQQEVSRLREELQAAQRRIAELEAELLEAKPRSEDKALIRVLDGDPEDVTAWKQKCLVPHAQVGPEVQRILEQGTKPEHIEVWTKRQRPKVRVELE